MALQFTVEKESASGARAGRLTTRQGTLPTPVFMPVATHAVFRHISMEDARSTTAPIILSNTYHLLDAPGPEVLREFGGIHRLTGWQGTVLTDSGGFQIFSLEGDRSITEKGAHFRLPSGRRHLLTPESSMDIQHAIGSDIMMALDVCVDATLPLEPTREAMERTHRWAVRSLEAHAASGSNQALFGIIQGGTHAQLREESAAVLRELPFDGFAIGGLAVGESKEERERVTSLAAPLLPAGKPRYLMGVGTPLDLAEAVYRGVDMFDCILPTKMAQQGYAYTFSGVAELMRPAFSRHAGPVEPGCPCLACISQPAGYIHHLMRGKHMQGIRLLAIHNIHHTQRLMARLRENIVAGTLEEAMVDLRAQLPRRIKEPLVPG